MIGLLADEVDAMEAAGVLGKSPGMLGLPNENMAGSTCIGPICRVNKRLRAA
jgi:hypothetical protein